MYPRHILETVPNGRDVSELTATVEVHLEVMYLLHLLEAVPNGRDVSELTATIEVHLEVTYLLYLLEAVPNGRDVSEVTATVEVHLEVQVAAGSNPNTLKWPGRKALTETKLPGDPFGQ